MQSHVQHLDISGNSYSLEFCEEFGKCIQELNTVQVMWFNLDAKYERRVRLAQERGNPSINFLYFQYRIPIQESPKTRFIQQRNRNLFIIIQSINGAIALKPYLSSASSLQIFLINNCGLGITGATHISQALGIGTPNLQVWAMSRNRIEDEGAVRLSEAIGNMQNLKELYIY